MQSPFDSLPPQMLVAVVGTVVSGFVTLVLGVALIRAWSRRNELRGGSAPLPADVSARLARIEAAVDSIAIEVERISENQRFLTKLQSERPPLASGGSHSDRPR